MMHRGWMVGLLATACAAAAWGQGAEPGAVRSLFAGGDAAVLPAGVAGRLGLLLVERGSARQVAVDHAFRHGDQIRLEVTSSRDAWLYVLHRAPEQEEAEVLWPGEEEEGDPEVHRVAALEKLVVPPPPTVIEFDEEVGREHLYVALTAEARAPMAGSPARGEEEPGAGGWKKIVNFSVRGLRLAAEKSTVFDPPDDDPYLYFSTPREESGALAAVEFRLEHR